MSAVAGTAAVPAYSAPAPADAQATLARLQHQLSDNVNCASARTPEGKATIAAIQDKIAVLNDRMEGKPSATAASMPAASSDAAAPTQSAAPARAGATSGRLIDVYA